MCTTISNNKTKLLPTGRKETDIMKKEVVINKARYDIVPGNKNVHKGKAVLCITTGEVFKSAKEAASYYEISYVSMLTQISGKTETCGGGIKNVNGNGMKFCYISEMGYKANDIANYIVELKKNGISRRDYDMVMMRYAESERENKELKFKIAEIAEKLHKIMALVGQE